MMIFFFHLWLAPNYIVAIDTTETVYSRANVRYMASEYFGK